MTYYKNRNNNGKINSKLTLPLLSYFGNTVCCGRDEYYATGVLFFIVF